MLSSLSSFAIFLLKSKQPPWGFRSAVILPIQSFPLLGRSLATDQCRCTLEQKQGVSCAVQHWFQVASYHSRRIRRCPLFCDPPAVFPQNGFVQQECFWLRLEDDLRQRGLWTAVLLNFARVSYWHCSGDRAVCSGHSWLSWFDES